MTVCPARPRTCPFRPLACPSEPEKSSLPGFGSQGLQEGSPLRLQTQAVGAPTGKGALERSLGVKVQEAAEERRGDTGCTAWLLLEAEARVFHAHMTEVLCFRKGRKEGGI